MASRDMDFNSQSGHVESVSYDDETQELSITFRGGRQYVASGVPESVAMGFESAPSAGGYFNSFIKDTYDVQPA